MTPQHRAGAERQADDLPAQDRTGRLRPPRPAPTRASAIPGANVGPKTAALDATTVATLMASLVSVAEQFSSLTKQLAEHLPVGAGTPGEALALLGQSEAVMDTDKTGMENTRTKLTLTAAETGVLLGLHPRTLSRMRAEGEGPKPIKIRGSLRYRRRDVERWLEGKRS